MCGTPCYASQPGYYRAPKVDIKNKEKDNDYLGETDLVGATCKMTIEASHRFGIELNCQQTLGNILQFNAESHAEQKHWYDAITDQIEVANDAVLRAQGISNDGMKSWYETKLAEQRAAIASLQTGRKMRKHYIAMGFHRMHDRLVKLDDTGDILLWCDPYATTNERNETTQTNSIPISSIISVKAGAETVALASFATSSDSAGRCFSIYTQEKSYDFECDTRDQRDDFINLLNIIREQLERSEVANNVEIKKKHEARRRALRDTVQKSKDLLSHEKKK